MALLVYLGIARGIVFSSILALGMVGAILGFLFHNFPPAKCYMGDSGAYMIGYVIAALSLLNAEKGAILAALLAPALALALPIVDVLFAMTRRAIQGLPLFRPDRGHIHHRLIRTGLSGRSAVLVLYAISLFALVGGLLAFADRGRHFPIFLGFAFMVLLFALRGQKISTASLRVLLADSLQSRQDTRNALYLKNWLMVEAERADSVINLWSDFRFVLKKMGFCRAELQIGAETRDFYVPHTAHEQLDLLWQVTHDTAGQAPVALTLYAEKENFSESQFALAADIAAEAWSGAWPSLRILPPKRGAAPAASGKRSTASRWSSTRSPRKPPTTAARKREICIARRIRGAETCTQGHNQGLTKHDSAQMLLSPAVRVANEMSRG